MVTSAPTGSTPTPSPGEPRLLSVREVCRIVGVSLTTIWRWEREGRFPARRKVGPNRVAWRWDEVAAWLDRLPVADPPRVER